MGDYQGCSGLVWLVPRWNEPYHGTGFEPEESLHPLPSSRRFAFKCILRGVDCPYARLGTHVRNLKEWPGGLANWFKHDTDQSLVNNF